VIGELKLIYLTSNYAKGIEIWKFHSEKVMVSEKQKVELM